MRLNTRPARPTVHASSPPSRGATPDSGPLWVANPSTYDSFVIHYTLPVLTGAQEKTKMNTEITVHPRLHHLGLRLRR